MSAKLIEEVRNFVARKQMQELAAICHAVAMPALMADPAKFSSASAERRVALLQGLSRRIRRERIRGLCSAAKYDLNRHIALKQLHDLLRHPSELRPPEDKATTKAGPSG